MEIDKSNPIIVCGGGPYAHMMHTYKMERNGFKYVMYIAYDDKIMFRLDQYLEVFLAGLQPYDNIVAEYYKNKQP